MSNMNWSQTVQNQQNNRQRQYGMPSQNQPRNQQRNQYQQQNNYQPYDNRNSYNPQNNRSSQNINNNNINNNINNNNNNQSQQTQNQTNQSLSSVPSKQSQSQQTVNVVNSNNNNNPQQQNISKQSVSAQTDNTNTIQPQQAQNISNDAITNQSQQTDNNNINNNDNVPDEESQQTQNIDQQQQKTVDVTSSEQQQQQQGQSSQIDNKEQDLVNDDQQSLASGTTPKKKPFSSANSINNKMFFGTRYEVKCDETFAYYEGYVFDYDEKENKLKVSYPWKADQSVPVNYVRPVAPAVDPSWKPKQGDHVECQAKAEESEPYGWWDCTIKTVRDNLYLITYEGWDNHHEVLQHNMLRPYNDQEPFEDVGIVRQFHEIKSQDRIQEFKDSQQNLTTFMTSDDKNGFGVDDNMNKSESTMDQLRRIAKQTNLIHLNFSPTEEKLILIGTEQQVKDARMLIDFVWSLRETYKQKEEDVKKQEKRQQREFDELKKCVKSTFKFDVSLTKYVIGLRGENISRAKEIEGVKHINVRNVGDDETMSECLILATDQNAADEARAILEMAQDYELIPADPYLRKELIGIEGSNIQDLEKRSNVIKICTLEHLKYIRDSQSRYNQYRRGQQNNDNDNNNYQASQSFIDEAEPEDTNYKKLIIIGPREKVPFAKLLIKQQVELIQQKSALLERKKNAEKDIYQKQTYYNDNNNNNNDDNNNNNYNGDSYYNDGYNGYGYDGYDGYDGYGNNNNNRYGGGNQQQSARRQRKREQQQATEQSNRDTSHFNYVDNQRGNNRQQQQNYASTNNDDPEFPQLGSNPKDLIDSQADSKDVSNEDENQQQQQQTEISWLEHDEAGMEEDEQENINDNNDNQQQQQQDQQRHGGRGGGARYQGSYDDRGYGDDRRRYQEKPRSRNKPIWKQKEKSTSSSTEVNNTSSNQ